MYAGYFASGFGMDPSGTDRACRSFCNNILAICTTGAVGWTLLGAGIAAINAIICARAHSECLENCAEQDNNTACIEENETEDSSQA